MEMEMELSKPLKIEQISNSNEEQSQPSQKSSTDEDKSTEVEEPTDTLVIKVGMKRHFEEEEEEEEEEEDVESDSEGKDGVYDYTYEELISLMEEDRRRDRTPEFMEKLRRYLKQVEESDGFECDEFPGYVRGLTTVRPRQKVIENRDSYPEAYAHIMYLAALAIEDYNERNLSGFEVKRIEKLNVFCAKGYTYYITFIALDVKSVGHEQTFLAKVYDNVTDNETEVHLCNLKAESVTGMDQKIDKRDSKEASDEEEGYECTDFPVHVQPRQIVIDDMESFPEGYSHIESLAILAIEGYNKDNGTEYKVSSVDKLSSMSSRGGYTYYITILCGNMETGEERTFEVEVWDKVLEREIKSCKPEQA